MKTVASIIAAAIVSAFGWALAIVVGGLGWLIAVDSWFIPLTVRIAFGVLLFLSAGGIAVWTICGAVHIFKECQEELEA